jgi:hypothetical protein
MTNRRTSTNRGEETNGLAAAKKAELEAEKIITGEDNNETSGRDKADDIVRTIARRISATQSKLNGGNTLETLARLTSDSLLNTPTVGQDKQTSANTNLDKGITKLKDSLDKADHTAVNEIFMDERGRFEDYQTYQQIYNLITQASEAVQTYCDNIISPDDFTKRDFTATYEGSEGASKELLAEIRRRCEALIDKYSLDDRIETAIIKSLTKGDFFMVILNLRQELESLLTVAPNTGKKALNEGVLPREIPAINESEMEALIKCIKLEENCNTADLHLETLREELAEYINGIVVFSENTTLAKKLISGEEAFGRDIESTNVRSKTIGKVHTPVLESTVGSIVKLVEPENVIKLYQNDTLFGYYYIETIGKDISSFATQGTTDQSAVIRSIDRSLSTRLLGSENPENQKEKLIKNVIIKSLAAKLGSAKFITDNPQFANDAYMILNRARADNKQVQISYVASDQMVHFTPNGALGYGDSVLSRVKFLAKLYLGAMTNAFMRNSIRRPEKLAWYLDVGVDNDATNSIENFIRTVKQREVKFSSLKDITTTMNHIGEFHDFYIPTINGNRPVEVETINMGAAAEVDSPFLEYLRKGVISGMGVPAAFLGYSEEIAFARSLTMDNGRFLRRVIRHQKHYGRATSKAFQILYRNEYIPLDQILGYPARDKDEDKSKPKKTARSKKKDENIDTDENLLNIIDISRIVVRFPSPATLNLTNLADSINQASPVADFLTDVIATGEGDDVKSAFKKKLLTDLMPQIKWAKYEELLLAAKIAAMRTGIGKESNMNATAE